MCQYYFKYIYSIYYIFLCFFLDIFCHLCLFVLYHLCLLILYHLFIFISYHLFPFPFCIILYRIFYDLYMSLIVINVDVVRLVINCSDCCCFINLFISVHCIIFIFYSKLFKLFKIIFHFFQIFIVNIKEFQTFF